MNDEIQSKLDVKLGELLAGALGQKDTADLVTVSLGIGKPHLVPFVAGMTYTSLQIYFVDLYKARGMAEEETLRRDWEAYWKKNVKSIIDQLTKIYEL